MCALLECASLAPSVGNAQPWRFVRVRSSTLRQALADHVDAQNAQAAQQYAAKPGRNCIVRSSCMAFAKPRN